MFRYHRSLLHHGTGLFDNVWADTLKTAFSGHKAQYYPHPILLRHLSRPRQAPDSSSLENPSCSTWQATVPQSSPRVIESISHAYKPLAFQVGNNHGILRYPVLYQPHAKIRPEYGLMEAYPISTLFWGGDVLDRGLFVASKRSLICSFYDQVRALNQAGLSDFFVGIFCRQSLFVLPCKQLGHRARFLFSCCFHCFGFWAPVVVPFSPTSVFFVFQGLLNSLDKG